MIPNGPCLLLIDGRPRVVRAVAARPDQPHPLLHAYGCPERPAAAPQRKER